MKFSIKGFFSKYYQIRRKLQIWSHLLKKSSMENFIFCVVKEGVKHHAEKDDLPLNECLSSLTIFRRARRKQNH